MCNNSLVEGYGTIILDADIDLSGEEWTSIVSPYGLNFNGNGHKIYNLSNSFFRIISISCLYGGYDNLAT